MVSTASCGPSSAAMPAYCALALTQEWQLIDKPLGRIDPGFGPDAVAEAPAGHGVGLGPAVEQDGAVAQMLVGEQAGMGFAVEQQPGINLVAQDGDMGEALQPGGERIDLGLGRHAAGRVGRAVEDDQTGPAGNLFQHLAGAEGEIPLLFQRDRHRRGAGEADHRFVDREAGVGIEDLGARLAEHHEREEHGRLAARHDEHARRIDLDPAMAQDVRRHRFAQPGHAGRRGIAVMAVGERFRRRLDDMVRGFEIRLADAEIDDVAALGRQRRRAGQDLEGGFGAEPPDAVGKLRCGHASCPRCAGARRRRCDTPAYG